MEGERHLPVVALDKELQHAGGLCGAGQVAFFVERTKARIALAAARIDREDQDGIGQWSGQVWSCRVLGRRAAVQADGFGASRQTATGRQARCSLRRLR